MGEKLMNNKYGFGKTERARGNETWEHYRIA